MTKTCVICGKDFASDWINANLCSDACRSNRKKLYIKHYKQTQKYEEYRAKRKAQRIASHVNHQCCICGKLFVAPLGRKTCSEKCKVENFKLITKRWDLAHRDARRKAALKRYYKHINTERERARLTMAKWRKTHPDVAKLRSAEARLKRKRDHPEEVRAYAREKQRQRRLRPDFIRREAEYQRRYLQRPDVAERTRARDKEYRNRPDVKQRIKLQARMRRRSETYRLWRKEFDRKRDSELRQTTQLLRFLALPQAINKALSEDQPQLNPVTETNTEMVTA